jgi:hypothetical protein
MHAEDGFGKAEELMTAALDTGDQSWIERQPGHGAATAGVGAGPGRGASIGHSVRREHARTTRADGRRI